MSQRPYVFNLANILLAVTHKPDNTFQILLMMATTICYGRENAFGG